MIPTGWKKERGFDSCLHQFEIRKPFSLGLFLFDPFKFRFPNVFQAKKISLQGVDCLIESEAKKALIRKRIHPHVIRHTFTTTLLDYGNDLRTVQSLMGHSHVRTTERYLHSTDDRKVEAIRSLQFGI